MSADAWSPGNPDGDMVPLLQASIEDAKRRHPSGKIRIILTQADRCDKCGAPAAYRLQKPPHLLDMCGHHWRENATAMFQQGWIVQAGRH
ncbi:hypothetical protein [Streptomyces sp. NPDC057686]|uniref:DUF7455 domain-containing protein n=1 Tax=Streptomyces sp. NPDC057686 TaxID=3346212 RepID=UPI0036C6FBAE